MGPRVGVKAELVELHDHSGVEIQLRVPCDQGADLLAFDADHLDGVIDALVDLRDSVRATMPRVPETTNAPSDLGAPGGGA